jgi:glycosyltransferase involved in cell wall biosynthesis
MKVLHISPELIKGGAERLLLDICVELTKRPDFEVMVVALREKNAYPFLTEQIKWKVAPSKVIPSITGKSVIDVAELQRTIDEFQPDIIHSHLFESEMALSEIRYNNAVYFVHFHDNMRQFKNLAWKDLFNKSRVTDFFEKRLLLKRYKNRLTEFITVSTDTDAFVKSVIPSRFNVHLLLNAIDVERFSHTKERGPSNRLTIVGSLVEKKGQDLAIQTIHYLKNKGIEVHLDILGDGVKMDALVKLSTELHVNDLVKFHGNVNHPEHFFENSFAYFHTASYEPFGLVLLEAMASGLPVICSDGKGNRDIIVEGENGFLVTERNPKLLADKIELLLNNHEMRTAMGKFAQSYVQSFGISAYVDTLITHYQNAYKKFKTDT